MDAAKTSARTWERMLASGGVVLSLAVCYWAEQKYSPISTMTARYLLEVAGVSVGCGACVWWSGTWNSSAFILPAWTAVGVLTGITLMGVWSIGPLLIPVDVLFITAAVIATNRKRASMPVGVGAYALATFIQAALMFH